MENKKAEIKEFFKESSVYQQLCDVIDSENEEYFLDRLLEEAEFGITKHMFAVLEWKINYIKKVFHIEQYIKNYNKYTLLPNATGYVDIGMYYAQHILNLPEYMQFFIKFEELGEWVSENCQFCFTEYGIVMEIRDDIEKWDWNYLY